jgi:iron complex outermembrane recepter protein
LGVNAALDVSYLLKKRSKLTPSAPFGSSEVGKFTRAGDIGVRWKHTASVALVNGPWTTTLSQLYRGGYQDARLPGIQAALSANPPRPTPVNWVSRVTPYETFDASVAYSGFKNLVVTAGIKNIFDEDPPFSAAYDTNTGAGSSWEPRVADPRGRAYTLRVEYKFF